MTGRDKGGLIGRILAALLLPLLLIAAAAPMVLADRQLGSAGSWTFYVNPFGSAALPAGSYANGMQIQADGDTARLSISHRYSTSFLYGVRGYNAVQFGAGRGAKPLVAWPARTVSEAAGLVQPFAYRVDRKSGEFNLLAETFLVATPTDNSSGELELGWQLYPMSSLWAYAKSGKGLGKGYFIDRDGIRWLIVLMPPSGTRTWPYVMMMPDRPVLSGTLHWGDALAAMVRLKLLTGREYIRGTFFGVEPVSGEATIAVDQLGAPAVR